MNNYTTTELAGLAKQIHENANGTTHMLSAVHCEQREIDVQKLCKAVLDVFPNCYDIPNGAYETTCPFCGADEYRGGSRDSVWASMSELNHESDCAYLIAKDLSTNYRPHKHGKAY